MIWRQIEEIGAEGISIVKVKGHATQADVDAGRSSEAERAGNDNADHFAGRGVEVAQELSPIGERANEHHRAVRWYQFLFELCASWPQDTDRAPQAIERERREEEEDEEEEEARRCFENFAEAVSDPRRSATRLGARGGPLEVQGVRQVRQTEVQAVSGEELRQVTMPG